MRTFIPTLLLALLLAGCQIKPQAPFSFGIVADIQYADKDPSGNRHYRTSLERLEECVGELNRCDLAFTIQLGDIIDGNDSPEATQTDLDTVLGTFNQLKMPKYHVIGNHCMTADREMLQQKLELEAFYYDFTVPEAPGWRFIVLDGNEGGYGILGAAQKAWLKTTLDEARDGREKVVVFCHFPLLERAAASHRMQEPEPVLELINNAGCVKAYFAGHDHAGGYALQDGIHHITIKGIVEAPDQNAFAIVTIESGQLQETGFGVEPSRELLLDEVRRTGQ